EARCECRAENLPNLERFYLGAERNDLRPIAVARGEAEPRPISHESDALLECSPAPIRGFTLILDGVSKRHLANLLRVAGTLADPIAEGTPEAMDGGRCADTL